MIKLSKILSEGRSSAISMEKALEIAQINNPGGISKYPIFRGGRNLKDDFYYIQPSLFNRKSAYTDDKLNYYTILIDNLPSWKEYPKRSRSIICSNNNDYANSYGSLYCVVPAEGSKIAICPSYDIWQSFEELNKIVLSVNELNGVLEEYIQNYETIMSDKINKDDYNDIIKAIDYSVKNHDKSSFTYIANEVIDYYNEYQHKYHHKYDTMSEFIDTVLLNPIVNGFDMKIYTPNFQLNVENREIWIQNDSILVESNKLYKFRNKLHSIIK